MAPSPSPPKLWILVFFLLSLGQGASRAEVVYHHDFRKGPGEWTHNNLVQVRGTLPEGIRLLAQAPDPFLVGPPVDFPPGKTLTVTIRMRGSGTPAGQVYFGKSFREEDSKLFEFIPDGKWHDYIIQLPALPAGSRIRLDPPSGDKDLELAWIRVEAGLPPATEAWAKPSELRGKKMVCGGQFTTNGGSAAVTSRYLAQHPDFTANFPFDGLIIPALIDSKWSKEMGLPEEDRFLHGVVWNATRIPAGAIDEIARDLKSVPMRGVTDNFLNYSMIDSTRGRYMPDFTNDKDWAILEDNARQAARLCRLSGMKGFWLDTEQYGNYRWRTESGVPEFDPKRPSNLKFPLGKDEEAVLRKRGRQWIEAVQKELPEIKIIITFAWSPDANEYGPIKGANGFLNGILEGIREPGQLIHGYENTFYFGQGPGTKHTKEGFPGGRERFESTRAKIRQWRSFSSNPKKYDTFLRTGMAAWVEDDPWALWEGWPSGGPETFWSNLPLALAYTDEYVWVWSEHTRYSHSPKGGINPFLSSLRNQTFNTGKEQVETLAEDFRKDPLQNGWHFDFDMLALAGPRKPGNAVGLMTTEKLPYQWMEGKSALEVRGLPSSSQRRRYTHPIRNPKPGEKTRGVFEFEMVQFGSNADNPMILGFFSPDLPCMEESLTFRAGRSGEAEVVICQKGQERRFPFHIPGGLSTGKVYSVSLEAQDGIESGLFSFAARIAEGSGDLKGKPIAQIDIRIPKGETTATWGEIGAALLETPSGSAPPKNAKEDKPCHYLVKKALFGP